MIAEEARADLIRRLGPGARHDDPAAPAAELTWARLGTAYFARKLNELTDYQLMQGQLATAGPRQASRVVAEVGYEARGLAQIVEWARTGHLDPGSDPFHDFADEVDLATTLPAAALRNLFCHAEVHLNVEWRDLDAGSWDAVVRLPGPRDVRVRHMARLRALSIWLRAFDLDESASFLDIPGAVIDAMLADAAASWTEDAFVLRPTDRPDPVMLGRSHSPQTIKGAAADLARWLTGRPPRRLTSPMPVPVVQPALRPFTPSNQKDHP